MHNMISNTRWHQFCSIAIAMKHLIHKNEHTTGLKQEEKATMKKLSSLFTILLILFFAAIVFPQAYRGKGRLRGYVKDETGQPITNVTVRLLHTKSNSSFETKSDNKGFWEGNWVRGGLWYIDFKLDGYMPKNISVTANEFTSNPDIDIVLKKVKGKVIPKEVMDKLDKANLLYDQKKYEEALPEYSKILADFPEVYLIYINIGNTYYDMGKYDKAIASYQKVLDKEPTNSTALMGMGNAYSQTEPAKAIEYYDKIAADELQDPVVLYNIASFYYNSGQSDKALKYYEQCVTVKADFIDALYQIGIIYAALTQNDKAIAAFENLLKYDTASPKAKEAQEFITILQGSHPPAKTTETPKK